MFKLFIWGAAATTTAAAALFVPIDPSVLKAIGIKQAEPGPGAAPAGEIPFKIVSKLPDPGEQSGIAVVRRPAVSPYTAKAPVKVVAVAPKPAPLTRVAASPLPKIPRAPVVQAAAPAPPNVVRNLQKELRRVGCYQGRIDGDWGPASRYAMSAFTRSVNAALPTDRPDIILLTLVRRHTGVACGQNRAAPVQTATPLVPSARVKTTQAWRVRVVPTPARPRLAKRPHLRDKPVRLVETPRIVRSDGRQPISVAAPASRYRPFNQDNRMALGVVPEPREALPITSPATPAAVPAVSRRRHTERRRVQRTRSVKRRRAWRRARSRSWRRQVFPNLNN